MNKHKSRQHARNELHYMSQWMRTHRNKLKRIKQSSGEKAANAYNAARFTIVVKLSQTKKKAA